MAYDFIGYLRRNEIENAGAERAAQLRIGGAFFAGRGVGCVFVLMLRDVLKSVAQRVRRSGLLGKQQGKGEKQRLKQAGRMHGGAP